jgi:hypothetical protein
MEHITAITVTVTIRHGDLWEGDGQDEQIAIDQVNAAIEPLRRFADVSIQAETWQEKVLGSLSDSALPS